MSRSRLIGARAALQDAGFHVFGNSRTVVFNADFERRLSRSGGRQLPCRDMHLLAAPLEGVVQKVTQHFSKVAGVAVKCGVAIYVECHPHAFVRIHLGERGDDFFKRGLNLVRRGKRCASRGGGALQLVFNEIRHARQLFTGDGA